MYKYIFWVGKKSLKFYTMLLKNIEFSLQGLKKKLAINTHIQFL